MGMLAKRSPASRTPLPFTLEIALFRLISMVGVASQILFPQPRAIQPVTVDVASSSKSQQFVLIGAAFVTPVVLAYSAFAYWIFPAAARPEKGWGRMQKDRLFRRIPVVRCNLLVVCGFFRPSGACSLACSCGRQLDHRFILKSISAALPENAPQSPPSCGLK